MDGLLKALERRAEECEAMAEGSSGLEVELLWRGKASAFREAAARAMGKECPPSKDSPCLGCAERSVGCHGACAKYALFKAGSDERAALRRASKRHARLGGRK